MPTRDECFKTLRLESSAGPKAIKQAYRKLAFLLHPDLNPDLPEAAKKFQQLNEAYVLLMQEYANTSYSAGAARGGGSGEAWDSSAQAEKSRAEAARAYRKAHQDFDAGAGAGGEAEAERGRRRNAGGGAGRGLSREDVLRELLNDPFARRVFDDIYSHVGRKEGGQTAQAKPVRPAKPAAKSRKFQVRPTASPLLLQLGSKLLGLAGNVKGWLRRRIDDEHVVFLPGVSLYPGARVRLQVRHGLSDKSRVVEFTLPPEFRPGLPIRLKGLGMRLGSLKGDLYLRVFEQEEENEAEE